MTTLKKRWERLLRLRNGRQLLSWGKTRGVPIPLMRRIVKVVQVVRSPRQFLKRKLLARQLSRHVPPSVRVPQAEGYVRFRVEEFPLGDSLVDICRKIHKDFDENTDVNKGGKAFLRNLLSEADLDRYPEILAFATSPAVLSTVSDYLGAVPTIGDIKLWSSIPTGRTDESSQLFHRDNEDFKQAKVFINVFDVEPRHGPLSLIPAATSERVTKELPTSFTRTPDEVMYQHCSRDELVELTGDTGDGAIVDTSRCFHYGSRSESGERVVLVIPYLGYHSVMEGSTKTLSPESRFRRRRYPDPYAQAAMELRPTRV